jgi:hypothetical protein
MRYSVIVVSLAENVYPHHGCPLGITFTLPCYVSLMEWGKDWPIAFPEYVLSDRFMTKGQNCCFRKYNIELTGDNDWIRISILPNSVTKT